MGLVLLLLGLLFLASAISAALSWGMIGGALTIVGVVLLMQGAYRIGKRS